MDVISNIMMLSLNSPVQNCNVWLYSEKQRYLTIDQFGEYLLQYHLLLCNKIREMLRTIFHSNAEDFSRATCSQKI